ncbi:hypothetical protein ES703_114444 [subsurface metagenome]
MAEMIPADQGRIVVVEIGDPIAGGNFYEQMPPRTRWRLISLTMRYTSDATSANRFFNLTILLVADVIMSFPVREEGLASQVRQVSWFAGGMSTMDPGHLASYGAIPERCLMNNRMILASEVQGIEAGDQIDHIFAVVEEWIEPLA